MSFINYLNPFLFIILFLISKKDLIESNECKVYKFINEFDTQDPFVLQTRDLTKKLDILDNDFLPYVGNGHLATTIFGDSVFMNGLYNGKEDKSHRAHIPNLHNFNILNTKSELFNYKQYALDLKSLFN